MSQPSARPRPLPVLVPALLLAVAMSGCGAGHGSKEAHGSGAEADTAHAVAVRVLAVTDTDASGRLVLPGRVEARSEVTLAARVDGRLTDLPLREGAAFRAGQTLAVFEAPEARSALEAARVRVQAAGFNADQALRQEARIESLYALRVTSKRDLELAQTAARAAEAERAGARAEFDRWDSGTRLLAPFDGVVVRRHVDPGGDVGAGQPLLDLRSRQAGEIAVALPESYGGVPPGGTIEVQVGDGPWRAGRLVRLEGMIDSASRTRTGYFALAAGHGAEGALEPGAFVRVRLSIPPGAASEAGGEAAVSAPRSVLVPSRSIVRRGGLTGVYVVEDGRARLRWVRTGRVSGEEVEVASGLFAGDRIVLDPAGLVDGSTVRVES